MLEKGRGEKGRGEKGREEEEGGRGGVRNEKGKGREVG